MGDINSASFQTVPGSTTAPFNVVRPTTETIQTGTTRVQTGTERIFLDSNTNYSVLNQVIQPHNGATFNGVTLPGAEDFGEYPTITDQGVILPNQNGSGTANGSISGTLPFDQVFSNPNGGTGVVNLEQGFIIYRNGSLSSPTSTMNGNIEIQTQTQRGPIGVEDLTNGQTVQIANGSMRGQNVNWQQMQEAAKNGAVFYSFEPGSNTATVINPATGTYTTATAAEIEAGTAAGIQFQQVDIGAEALKTVTTRYQHVPTYRDVPTFEDIEHPGSYSVQFDQTRTAQGHRDRVETDIDSAARQNPNLPRTTDRVNVPPGTVGTPGNPIPSAPGPFNVQVARANPADPGSPTSVARMAAQRGGLTAEQTRLQTHGVVIQRDGNSYIQQPILLQTKQNDGQIVSVAATAEVPLPNGTTLAQAQAAVDSGQFAAQLDAQKAAMQTSFEQMLRTRWSAEGNQAQSANFFASDIEGPNNSFTEFQAAFPNSHVTNLGVTGADASQPFAAYSQAFAAEAAANNAPVPVAGTATYNGTTTALRPGTLPAPEANQNSVAGRVSIPMPVLESNPELMSLLSEQVTAKLQAGLSAPLAPTGSGYSATAPAANLALAAGTTGVTSNTQVFPRGTTINTLPGNGNLIVNIPVSSLSAAQLQSLSGQGITAQGGFVSIQVPAGDARVQELRNRTEALLR